MVEVKLANVKSQLVKASDALWRFSPEMAREIKFKDLLLLVHVAMDIVVNVLEIVKTRVNTISSSNKLAPKSSAEVRYDVREMLEHYVDVTMSIIELENLKKMRFELEELTENLKELLEELRNLRDASERRESEEVEVGWET